MTVKTVVHRVHASSGPHRQLLVVLLFVGILLMKLDFVAGDINCKCDVEYSNCSDSAQSYLLNIAGVGSKGEVTIQIESDNENCSVSCICNEAPSCGSIITTAVLVPLVLEALIIGGVIALILLWKWRRKLITSWPTLKIYVEHVLHNPTYGAEDCPTSPSTRSSLDNVGPTDLYEEISEVQQDNKTDTPVTSCYAYVVPELHRIPSESECTVECTPTSSTTVTPDPQAAQKSQKHEKSKAGKAVTAYAVSSIAVTNKKTSRSFSRDIDESKATGPFENASRHFSEGKAPLSQHKRRKPKPAPMPKKLRELTVMKTKSFTQSNAGANNQQTFSASTSVPESEKYSKLNPKTQYMGLEPHIGSNGKRKKDLADVPASKEKYSHLKH